MDATPAGKAAPINRLNPGDFIMFAILEWLLDISIAVGSAAATGSILMLLVEFGKVTGRHFVQRGGLTALKRFGSLVQMQRVKQVG
jgi:hypothetical protein